MFFLKILCYLLERWKCFSIKFKNIFATLVDTSKLDGGLNLTAYFVLVVKKQKQNNNKNIEKPRKKQTINNGKNSTYHEPLSEEWIGRRS